MEIVNHNFSHKFLKNFMSHYSSSIYSSVLDYSSFLYFLGFWEDFLSSDNSFSFKALVSLSVWSRAYPLVSYGMKNTKIAHIKLVAMYA